MSNVVEVTDATFVSEVLEESRRRPVVVDFWADWCQPCRMIGPVLERMAEESDGAFLLAKLDVDANPQASQAFRIQSIPAVKAFRDGKLVNEFVGAIPEASIRQFLQSVLPSEADGLVERAEVEERAGRTEEAERLYKQALEEDPAGTAARVGLARLAALRGEDEEARKLLEAARPDPEAERLLAALEVSGWADPSRNGEGAQAGAERAAADGRFDEALAGFLQRVRSGGEAAEGAREAMLKVFAVLGEEDPLTVEYRRKLANALF